MHSVAILFAVRQDSWEVNDVMFEAEGLVSLVTAVDPAKGGFAPMVPLELVPHLVDLATRFARIGRKHKEGWSISFLLCNLLNILAVYSGCKLLLSWFGWGSVWVPVDWTTSEVHSLSGVDQKRARAEEYAGSVESEHHPYDLSAKYIF